MKFVRAYGFSLLEILVVLTIIALTMAVTIPVINRGSIKTLDETVSDVYRAMRAVRVQSLTEQKVVSFYVDVNSQTYKNEEGELLSLPPGIKLRAEIASPLNGKDSTIFRFFPDGSSTGGVLIFSQEGRIFSIKVDWLTGRITLSDGAGN